MWLRLLAVALCLAFVGACGGGAEEEEGSSAIDAALSTLAILQAEPVAADGAMGYDVEVTVRDGSGRPVALVPVSFEVSGQGNEVSQPTPTDEQGKTGGHVRTVVSGSKMLHVWMGEGGAKRLLGSRTLDFVPGEPAAIQLLALPDRIGAGAPFSIRALIVDGGGNLVRSLDDREFTVRLLPNPHGASLAGRKILRPLFGRLMFDDLAIERAGGGLQVEIVGPGLSPVRSLPFEVDPDGLDRLQILTSMRDTTLDRGLPPVEVVGVDRYGNPIVNRHLTVRLSLQGIGALGGIREKWTFDGHLTFDDLSIDRPGEFRIVARGGGFSTATNTFLVEEADALEPVVVYHGGFQTVEQRARLTIQVRDETGRRRSGVSVTMVGDDTVVFAPATGRTGSDGRLEVSVATTVAGVHRVAALVEDRQVEKELVFLPGQTSTEKSSLELSGGAVGPGEAALARVRLADRFDNPIVGVAYRLDGVGSDAAALMISPSPMFQTDENGAATLEVKADTSGSYRLGLFRGTSNVPLLRTRLEVH